MKKSQIQEIIDGDGNLIGTDGTPKTGKDRETDAKKTTDYNATVHGQNFKNDFLGRFGFYFYESEDDASKLRNDLAALMFNKFRETLSYYHEHPDMLKRDFEKDVDFYSQPEEDKEIDFEWADKVMDIIEPHLKKKLDESKVVEDKVVEKKKDEMKSKKDDDHELTAKAKKLAELINDLPKDQRNKLKNIIEDK